ncbi:hypothetical protein ACE38W_02940 [Chitinophaga sp. Hz27]|uniref:hypothetical protein n=1 Tax=Chitinophaga sp. Hz27 TaxID=3347169 RepID=UPI0035DECCCB
MQKISVLGIVGLLLPGMIYLIFSKRIYSIKLEWLHVVLSLVCTVLYFWLLFDYRMKQPPDSGFDAVLDAVFLVGYMRLLAFIYLGIQTLLIINVALGFKKNN